MMIHAPLQGLRVLAIEQAVAGPLCSRLLADLGADVVKIEPLDGDFSRHWDSTVHGLSSYFVWLNRGKRSVGLNLRTEEARAILQRMVGTADVLVQNLAPATARRHALDADGLKDRDGLVYCGISGYGSDGPYGSRKAYDLIVQAESGVLALTGTEESPAKVGVPVCDIAAGMYAANAVLAGLVYRERTGKGAQLEVTMLDAMVDWLGGPLTAVANGASHPRRSGVKHNMIVPYGPFLARDNEWVVLAVESPSEWRTFCSNVLGQPDLGRDRRFATMELRLENRNELDEIVSTSIAQRDSSDWFRILAENRIAYGRINDLSHLLAHPQVVHRGLIEQASSDGLAFPAGASAARWPGFTKSSSVPQLGEHTERVMLELGYTYTDVGQLRARDVIR